ncbi:hypothetical protein DOY81_002037 [Sarcophaga bullata]|nr:hypothetical protein DOY81_002037 [Sarcophaga bullata]
MPHILRPASQPASQSAKLYIVTAPTNRLRATTTTVDSSCGCSSCSGSRSSGNDGGV